MLITPPTCTLSVVWWSGQQLLTFRPQGANSFTYGVIMMIGWLWLSIYICGWLRILTCRGSERVVLAVLLDERIFKLQRRPFMHQPDDSLRKRTRCNLYKVILPQQMLCVWRMLGNRYRTVCGQQCTWEKWGMCVVAAASGSATG